MGQELTSVQYRSVDEQLFRAMQTLFDQKDRHFAIRFHGGPKAPLFVTTPTMAPLITRPAMKRTVPKRPDALPFARRMPAALEAVKTREQKLVTGMVDGAFSDEPATAKRRIKKP